MYWRSTDGTLTRATRESWGPWGPFEEMIAGLAWCSLSKLISLCSHSTHRQYSQHPCQLVLRSARAATTVAASDGRLRARDLRQPQRRSGVRLRRLPRSGLVRLLLHLRCLLKACTRQSPTLFTWGARVTTYSASPATSSCLASGSVRPAMRLSTEVAQPPS